MGGNFDVARVQSTFSATKSLDHTAQLHGISPEQVYWAVKVEFKLKPVRTYEDRETVRDNYMRAVRNGTVGLLADRIERSVDWVHETAIAVGVGGPAVTKARMGVFAERTNEAAAWLEDFRVSGLGIVEYAKARSVNREHVARFLKHHFPEEYSSLLAKRSSRSKSKVVGAKFENKVAQLLRDRGYHVFKPHRSWGAVDVYAMRPLTDLVGACKALFVQCKFSDVISPEEHNNLLLISTQAGAVPLTACENAGAVTFHRLTAQRVARGLDGRELYEP